jgi:putative membrane protein
MFVCLIMALLNAIIKPLLVFISMPINFLTLGLFMFVINALLFMLAGAIAPGFAVNGFFSALLGSVLLSIFAMGIEKV